MIGALEMPSPLAVPSFLRALRMRLREGLARRRHDHLAAEFHRIHERNLWGDAESRSGPGSTLAETAPLREALPALLRDLGVRSLLDAPCGDCNWIAHVDLGNIAYSGLDIVPALIDANARRFAERGWQFAVADLTRDPLPAADAILCRDCLIHLSFAYVHEALANFRRSGASWLITTTYRGSAPNHDIPSGSWRPLDLETPPFSLPPPAAAIPDGTPTQGMGRRSLAAWRLSDLP